MAPHLLDEPVTRWYCPNCDRTDVTFGLHPNRFHACPGLHGLTAPFVREGVYAKVVAEQRQDYLNGEVQRTGDDGRPYMAVRTLRNDGEDLAVNAGLATGSVRDLLCS